MKTKRTCRRLLLSLLLAAAPLSAADKAPQFRLADPGVFPVPYERFGSFTGEGTDAYKYKITDRPGLGAAMGEGLYPNFSALAKDRAYLAWKKRHSADENPWDHVNSGDPQSDFYVWATARDVGPGAKLYFTAGALAEAGLVEPALKAYHAVLVNFPKEPVWSADHTFVWYVADAALGELQALLRHHPEVGYELVDASFKVENGQDTDTKNDKFEINPGRWRKAEAEKTVDLSRLQVIRERGTGRVRLREYENKHWQMIVDGQPFVVHGVSYSPTPVGQHISTFGHRWMTQDDDHDGRPDYPYETFVDANLNGRQDKDEPSVGDFTLLRRMGVNAIRLYRPQSGVEYDPSAFNKTVLRDLYKTYGIRVIMGDLVGAYTVGSGAQWDDGTDYTDPKQLDNMRRIITAYVKDHRKEPYVLMWLLGNENLMPSDYSGVNATRTKAARQVQAYLTFINELAGLIHKLDPDHPVAVGNLELIDLADHAKYAPNVDIFGANLYRGKDGFGTMWKTVQDTFDRPVLVTEFGSDAWDSRTGKEDQKDQADYLRGNWEDIGWNVAGGKGVGNAVGGVIFEFSDEWWKSPSGSEATHDTGPDDPMPFADGQCSEEWFGVVSLGDGDQPMLRQPRQAYYLFANDLWKRDGVADAKSAGSGR